MTEADAKKQFEVAADRLGVGREIVDRILSGEKPGDVFNKKQKWAIETVGRLCAGEDLAKVAKELDYGPKELLRLLEVPRKYHALILNRTMMQLNVVLSQVPEALLEILTTPTTDKNLNGKGQVCRLLLQAGGFLTGDLQPREPGRDRKQLIARVRELEKNQEIQDAMDAADTSQPFLDLDAEPGEGEIH